MASGEPATQPATAPLPAEAFSKQMSVFSFIRVFFYSKKQIFPATPPRGGASQSVVRPTALASPGSWVEMQFPGPRQPHRTGAWPRDPAVCVVGPRRAPRGKTSAVRARCLRRDRRPSALCPSTLPCRLGELAAGRCLRSALPHPHARCEGPGAQSCAHPHGSPRRRCSRRGCSPVTSDWGLIGRQGHRRCT